MVMLRRYQTTNLYLIGGVDPQHACFGVVADPSEVLPGTWDLLDTWVDYARYIFFPRQNATSFLTNPRQTWSVLQRDENIRIAWMHTPERIAENSIHTLGRDSHLIRGVGITHENFTLGIPTRTEVILDGRGFWFDSANAGRSQTFLRGGGENSCPIEGNASLLEIVDQAGNDVGRFCARLMLNGRTTLDPATHVLNDFDRLDIGLRYYKDRSTTQVTSSRFALFQSRYTNEAVQANLYFDRFNVEAGESASESSYLDLGVNDAVGTLLRTTSGCELELSPVANLAGEMPRLVFTRHRNEPPSVKPDLSVFDYYLAPKGTFIISAVKHGDGSDSTSGRHRLTCGKSGLEEIAFSVGDRISFIAYEKAHYQPNNDSSAAEKLIGASHTSWISLLGWNGESEPVYYSQPDDAPLYTPVPVRGLGFDDTPTSSVLDIFEYQHVPLVASRDLPPIPLAPSSGFRPSVSRDGGVDIYLDDYVTLESKILEPERRRILGGIAKSTSLVKRGRLLDTVTPQGLLVKVDVDNSLRFDQLDLARSQPSEDAEDGDIFGFDNVWGSEDFSNALNRNELFAVMSGVPAGALFDRNLLEILEWTFAINLTPDADEARPLLIMKFYDGKSVAELVEDRSVWAAGLFQDSDQRFLREFVAEVRSRRLTDPAHYEGIFRKIEDPNWSGVLAINIPLNGNSLPGALKGLAAGINRNKFLAHHVGINASRYKPSDSGVEIELVKSSLFALVDYRDRDAPPAGGGGGDFEFAVEKLQVLFEQSSVRGFGAEVRLGVKRPFKQRSSGNNADDSIVIIGSHQKKNGVDTYTFVARNRKEITLYNAASGADPESRFIDKMILRRVEMVSETDEPNGGSTTVNARFTISANIDLGSVFSSYLCLEDVACDNLVAVFRFRIREDGHIFGFQHAAFDPGVISIDLSGASKCAGSLLNYLPVEFKRFHFAPGNLDRQVSLIELGFLPLTPRTDGASSTDVKSFDYALTFALDLGSLGALAQPLKDFKAEILLGWFAGDRSDEKVLGIRLPEGKLQLGIQGVLELLIKRFYLEVCAPSASNPAYYAIALHDCQIRVFGNAFPGDRENLDVFLFPNPVAPLSSPIGWFGGITFDGDSFVGAGQRLAISTTSPSPSAGEVVEQLKGWATTIGTSPDEDDFLELRYSKDNDWTAAIDFEVVDGARLTAVFNDPHLYALKLGVDPPGFAIDVLYRKVADDLGVYSSQLTLPDSLRQIEMGAASLTLPVIGADIYTNGDFRLDLGFPWDVDFQRSFALQMFPFIGKGGIYVGRLNGKTSTLLADDRLDMVAIIGFGLSVGLGKEFDKGILRAGISVSLYGILEGALGYTAGDDIRSPKAYCLVGRVGLLIQIFGTVDFGVVKVSVTIILEAGIPFRIKQDFDSSSPTFSIAGIDASVTATAEVVIGRVKVFGKSYEVTITYSFNQRYRFRFPIGEDSRVQMLPLNAISTAPRELLWQTSQFENLHEVLP